MVKTNAHISRAYWALKLPIVLWAMALSSVYAHAQTINSVENWIRTQVNVADVPGSNAANNAQLRVTEMSRAARPTYVMRFESQKAFNEFRKNVEAAYGAATLSKGRVMTWQFNDTDQVLTLTKFNAHRGKSINGPRGYGIMKFTANQNPAVSSRRLSRSNSRNYE